MSWIFSVGIVLLIGLSVCESANLTAITWKHKINSHKSLKGALKSDAKAIVGNVIMGFHKQNLKEAKIPVMHQKGFKSDFSLEEFITEAIDANNTKIIRLIFSTIDPVADSIDILLNKRRQIKFPIWLHANILMGPGGELDVPPVPSNLFIEQVKKMDNVVLSIGWSTTQSEDVYKKKHIEAMEKILTDNKLNTTDYKDMSINFPIHAVHALKSQDVLKSFYDNVKKTNAVAYTVRSRIGDIVDAEELKKFIKSYGIENIYIDLHDELQNKLNLGNGASTLVQFGLLNLITLFVVAIFRH